MNPTNHYEEHWTPSTRDVMMSYTDNRYQEWGAEMEEADAEFDRWFASEIEKAERRGAVLATARRIASENAELMRRLG